MTQDPSTPDNGSTGVAVLPPPDSNGSRSENGPDQTTDPPPTHVGVEPPPVGGNPAVPPGNGGRTGLAGMSTKYNDFHCQRIQATHGQRIPPNATIVEVDGQRLPISNVAQLQNSPSPVLFLSRGMHAVRFRPGERVRVTEGPLAGLEAVFQGPGPAERVRILIRFLGQANRAVVSEEALEKVVERQHPPRRTRGKGRAIRSHIGTL